MCRAVMEFCCAHLSGLQERPCAHRTLSVNHRPLKRLRWVLEDSLLSPSRPSASVKGILGKACLMLVEGIWGWAMSAQFIWVPKAAIKRNVY